MKLPANTNSIVPYPDETLMSFLTRVAIDLQIRVADLLREVNGGTAISARHGERRPFDWERLGLAVGVSPDVLFEMSERSFIVRRDDNSRLSEQHFRAFPWCQI